MPAPARLREAFDVIERHVEQRYGIPVVIKDVPNPFSGDLDGAEIHVDYDEEIDSALFILAHLFGHTVQWSTSAEAREIGTKLQLDPPPELIGRLYEYEREACELSLQLFHEAGIRDLDQWLSDYAQCDFEYLLHFYKTREKRPFKSFWRPNQPLLKPRPIPAFHVERWRSRWEGLVV